MILLVNLARVVFGSFAGRLFVLTLVGGVGGIIVLTAVIGYVIHSLFPAIDTYLLDALPDTSRASACARRSAGMMSVQATGSSAVGTLREPGVAYDLIFTRLALGLGVVVAVLAVLRRRGTLPQ